MGFGDKETYLDSELLSTLRSFVEAYPALEKVTGEVAQFKIVLDANIAVGDLIFKYRNPHVRQTAIEETVKSSAMELYAPTWLEKEMVGSTIPQVSQRRKIPQQALLEIWAEYRKQIIWDDSLSDPSDFSQETGDAKDVPYIDLQRSIEAAAILSRDSDIEQMGGKAVGLKFVISLREYARASAYSVGIQFGGMVVSTMSIHAIIGVVKGVSSLLNRIPPRFKIALFFCALVAIAHPTSRGKILKFLTGAGNLVIEAWPHIEELIDLASEKKLVAEKALAESETHLVIEEPNCPYENNRT